MRHRLLARTRPADRSETRHPRAPERWRGLRHGEPATLNGRTFGYLDHVFQAAALAVDDSAERGRLDEDVIRSGLHSSQNV